MSEENQKFDLRAAYQELLNKVPTVEALREKGLEEETARHMAKINRVTVECIGKVLEEYPGDDEHAMFTLNSLAAECQRLDSLSVGVREDVIIQMHCDEDGLNKLL